MPNQRRVGSANACPQHLKDTGLCWQPPTWDQQRRYLDTALRDMLLPTNSSSLQGTLASSSCACSAVALVKPGNFSGSTELLKAQIRHLPSRRATTIQTAGATMARCMMEEHMYLGQGGDMGGEVCGEPSPYPEP